MPAIDTVTAQVTFSNNVLVAMAASAGDTLQIRSIPPGKTARLLSIWGMTAAGGVFQVTSPRFHDNTRGLRFRVTALAPQPLINHPCMQKLYDQDQLAISLQAADAAGNIEHVMMLVYYEDLQGISARFIDEATLMKRGVEQVTVEDSIAAGAAGGYSGEEAINAESDLLKANTDYALVGYRTSVVCAGVTWRGADTGNLRVSGPGDPLGGDYTSDWFQELSRVYQLPLIPVFNSANRGGILAGVVQTQAAAAVTLSHNFVELA